MKKSKPERPLGLPKGAVVVRLGKVYDGHGNGGEIALEAVTADRSVRIACGDCPWRESAAITRAPDGTLYVLGGQGPAARLAAHRRGEACQARQRVNGLVRDGWQKVTSLVLRDALLRLHKQDRAGEIEFWEVSVTGSLLPLARDRDLPEVWASKRVCELFSRIVERHGPTLDVSELASFLAFADRSTSAACDFAWPGEGGGIVRLYPATPEMRRAELARAIAAVTGVTGDEVLP